MTRYIIGWKLSWKFPFVERYVKGTDISFLHEDIITALAKGGYKPVSFKFKGNSLKIHAERKE